MGQHQSSHTPATPKGPPPRPDAQPTAKPLSQLGPQGPSYVDPQNKVLPVVLPPSAKSLLRPVSQELSEYHPEYKEIFGTDKQSEDENVANGNVIHDQSGQQWNEQDMNGNVSSKTTNGHIPGLDNRNGNLNRRQVSMYHGGNSNNNIRGHRRQLSASSSLYSKENTIIEHPDEPKYGDDKPKKVTLPAKSTFGMPYSENLTYAQLAAYRQNQTLAELERKTGRKIEDLSAYADTKASTLERTPSTRSAKSSKSTGSAVSKKKSRAPPPPSQPPNPPSSKSAPSTPRGTNMHTPTQRPNKPPPVLKSYSLEKEPPADYDDAEPRKSVSINRSASSASGARKTPQPPPNAPPPPPVNGILRNSSNRNNKSMSELPRTNITDEFIRIRSPPVRQNSFNKQPAETEQNKFLSEIQKAAETRAMRRQISEPAEMPHDAERKSLVYSAEKTNNNSSENDKIEVASSSQTKQAPPPVAIKPNRSSSSSSSFERQNSVTSESSITNSVQSSSSSDQNAAIRRLSSLLQHDIKIAAQAKATKIVKHATPVKEKPKDPAQVFREQLAKAAFERDSRAKTGPTIDEQLKAAQAEEKRKEEENILFYTDQVTVKRSDSVRKQNEQVENEKLIKAETSNYNSEKVVKSDVPSKVESSKEVLTIKKEEFPMPDYSVQTSNTQKQNGEVVRHPRQMLPESDAIDSQKESYRNSVYASKDWTPELDLDSDDNISDSDIMTSSMGKSNGFKSTVLPSKVNEMNYKGKKQKGKERKFKKHSDSEEKKKHGSIKKFKNSVHKSVLNAFGSISKASGKVLKKSKSEEMDHVDNGPKNWMFSSSSSTPSFGETPVSNRPNLTDGPISNRAYKYMVPNGYQDHQSSSDSDEDTVISNNNKVMFESNGHIESNEDSDHDEDQEQKYLKRAGVAYVSKSGQIVVLPEYDKVPAGYHAPGDYDNHAPKLKSKKKKFTFDATVRRKEREQLNEQISMDTAEKEKKREEERRKEIEAEMEIKRTREQEARERLQRLEIQAQMHQQLLQQQQQYGMLSGPPLPPPNGFQQGYNPLDYSQLFAQQSGYGLPYSAQTGYSTPVFNNSMPNMSYDLSEYMRMMGVQTPTQNTSSQHYAYLLNGGFNWPQASLISYQNKVQQHQDDSKRNQVYQTWTGPTKQIVKSTNNSQSAKNNNSAKTSMSIYSAEESDSSAGLSPQRTDASLSASRSSLNNKDDSYGYKSKISVTTIYTPGLNKSAPSDAGDNNDDR